MNKENRNGLVSFAGVLEVLHALPGRLRLRIPSLKGRARAAETFVVQMKSLSGIESVTVNATLGTALVQYDAARLTPSLVVAACTHAFDFDAALAAQQSLVGRELKTVYFALNQAVLKRTGGLLDLSSLMTVVLLFALGRGVLGLSGTKFAPLPLLWWLQRSLSR